MSHLNEANPEKLKDIANIFTDNGWAEHEKELKAFSDKHGVSNVCALDVLYLRTRARWTQKLEDELIELHKTGNPPNIMDFGTGSGVIEKVIEKVKNHYEGSNEPKIKKTPENYKSQVEALLAKVGPKDKYWEQTFKDAVKEFHLKLDTVCHHDILSYPNGSPALVVWTMEDQEQIPVFFSPWPFWLTTNPKHQYSYLLWKLG